MPVSKVVKKEELSQILEEWLLASDVSPTTSLELFFLPGEVVIRPHSAEQQELMEWFEDFSERYEDVLQKLAQGPGE